MPSEPGYGQFCPIAVATEVLAQRWTLLVIRELLLGSSRFSELQRGVPRMSPALLSRRLRELELAGLIESRRSRAVHGRAVEYRLTAAGRELYPVVESMGLWAQRWLRHKLFAQRNLDPDLLMWDIRRRAILRSPAREGERYVAEFQLSVTPAVQRCYWLVFERGHGDLCYKDPGFEVDLYVSVPLRVLAQVWLGHLSIDQAIGDGQLRLHGTRGEIRAFRSWFALSVFAPAGPASGTTTGSVVEPAAERPPPAP